MDLQKGRKRGPKVVEPSLIRYERIRELLEREDLTIKAFSESLGREPGNVSRIIRSWKISEDFINQVVLAYPDYRKEWLFGYDNYPTYTEMNIAKERGAEINAPVLVLDQALREVCAREGIDVPTLDNIPELMLIVAQLKDYAVSLMWNYVKWKPNSHVWGLLEQTEKTKNRRNGNG